jgi:ribosome biogenesis protein SSF1/2
VGISKPLRRLDAAEKLLKTTKGGKGGMPNLGRLKDISEFMIGGENGDGYTTDFTSGSEADTDAEVEVLETAPRRVLSAKARAAQAAAEEEDGDDGKSNRDHVEKRTIKMVELGPRMRLRLTKVEEGLCGGKIMWHQYVHKTREEQAALEKKWEQRRKEKEARKKQQKENIEKKKKANGGNKKSGDAQDEDEMDVDDYSDLYSNGGFDSEGLEGDAEEQVNAQMEENGEWEDEEEEIADAHKSKKRALKG